MIQSKDEEESINYRFLVSLNEENFQFSKWASAPVVNKSLKRPRSREQKCASWLAVSCHVAQYNHYLSERILGQVDVQILPAQSVDFVRGLRMQTLTGFVAAGRRPPNESGYGLHARMSLLRRVGTSLRFMTCCGRSSQERI